MRINLENALIKIFFLSKENISKDDFKLNFLEGYSKYLNEVKNEYAEDEDFENMENSEFSSNYSESESNYCIFSIFKFN